MMVKNKWNSKTYTVISTNVADNTVTLKREDGSQFTIQIKELYFSYREVKDKHGIN